MFDLFSCKEDATSLKKTRHNLRTFEEELEFFYCVANVCHEVYFLIFKWCTFTFKCLILLLMIKLKCLIEEANRRRSVGRSWTQRWLRIPDALTTKNMGGEIHSGFRIQVEHHKKYQWSPRTNAPFPAQIFLEKVIVKKIIYSHWEPLCDTFIIIYNCRL